MESCRHYVAAYLGVLNGADAIVFTGGVGQFGKAIRSGILANFDYAGVVLDAGRNQSTTGKDEQRVSADTSRTQVWVVPTNEELIVARQTVGVLTGSAKPQAMTTV